MRRIVPLLLMLACSVTAAETELKMKMFPGVQSLPVIAAAEHGLFARQGLKVDVLYTMNSQEQRDGLAKGEFQIAQSAVDNAIAMVELARADVVIVAGGDSSMNEFIVQPDIRSYADFKGQTLLVDAPNTAYAVQLKKILLNNGLREGTDYQILSVGRTGLRLQGMKENKAYKGAMLNLPFSLEAKAAGLTSMGRAVDLLGRYQGNGTIVMRNWAAGNRETLERYLAGLIEGTRWLLAPGNRQAAAKMLSERFKVSPQIAAQAMEMIAEPRFGIAPDARLDMDGLRNVLALRAEIEGTWGGKAPPPDRYVDLSYYNNAVKRVMRQ
jgi:ABC-type nitrate/sulfonate/bicarbonate transport system substrate-binding protein